MSVALDVKKSLTNLKDKRNLRKLIVGVLGYEDRGSGIDTSGWKPELLKELKRQPVLLASGGREGRFVVVYTCLSESGRVPIGAQRRVMERMRNDYPNALFVFSDSNETVWHFVNVPYANESAGRKQYRRIVVSPENGYRTATERLAMISLDDLARDKKKDPDHLSPLEIQLKLDEAFDVAAVTKDFFREYREVFEYVEARVQGIDDPEDRRLFVQRLFNRLMFIAFIEKKGWLKLGSRIDYLSALWDHYKLDGSSESFYKIRLRRLFFAGFNSSTRRDNPDPLIGEVPYLNGGLFEKDKEYDCNPRVEVPDECFGVMLKGLFRRFNFTTTESTPLDVEVAVDPEMLGRVFEELVTGRHETGSYYTPKPIVSFMCREALKGHLEARLPDNELEAIRRFVEDHDSEGLIDPEATLNVLREVRVCDPACGSGAYLLGMVRELLDLRESLFRARNVDARSDYERKLEIIQNNIYGVDIDDFAVNIARLRLWLSLMVDFEGEHPPPLPNLDFKIEVGDSLIAPDPLGGASIDFIRQGQIDEYFDLKTDYLNAYGEDKTRLRGQIDGLRESIADWSHANGGVSGFDWPVEFAEVFAEGGFDVILANPPYVRQELIKDRKPILKSVFPEVYTGTSDLYVYFYARALQLLRPGGMIVFISSNKWFRANYGSNLRKHIADTCHVFSITDFGDLPVFESATAYPMIFAAQKGHTYESGGPTVLTQVESLNSPYPDVASLIREQGSHLPTDAIRGSDWSLTNAATSTRLKKMRASGIPLGEYVKGQIYRGVLTGFNKAFVINGAKREALISQDPKSAEIIKPFAVGQDVRKWHIDLKDRWLIFTRRGIDIKNYPAIKEHLSQWKPELTPKKTGTEKVGRKPGSYKWYEIQDNTAYYEVFEQPKIVYQEISTYQSFAFDTSNTFVNNKVFTISAHDLYLLGVLNSSSAWWYLDFICSKLAGGAFAMQLPYVSTLPIPNAPIAEREAIATLVQRCLDANGMGCEEWEQEIDERVSLLYESDIREVAAEDKAAL